MNVEVQMKSGGLPDGALAAATVHDLIGELKTRCHACVVVLLVDDDEGDERILTRRLGGLVQAVGLMRCAEATMLAEIEEKECE